MQTLVRSAEQVLDGAPESDFEMVLIFACMRHDLQSQSVLQALFDMGPDHAAAHWYVRSRNVKYRSRLSPERQRFKKQWVVLCALLSLPLSESPWPRVRAVLGLEPAGGFEAFLDELELATRN